MPALYAVIRDQIVAAIADGTYPPGSLLPSNSEIQERWNVSHATSRRVLQELQRLGWARSGGTRGYIATAGPGHPTAQATQDEPADMPSQASPPPGQTVPTQATQSMQGLAPPPALPRPAHTVPLGGFIPPRFASPAQIIVRTEPAPAPAAHALHIEPGEPVNVRRRVLTDTSGTVPVEVRTSYTRHVVEGSPLACPAAIPEPWPRALTEHTGHAIRTASSHISARHPDVYEAAALQLPADGIVLVRTTTYETDTGELLDFTASVWPAASTGIYAHHHHITD